MIKERYCEKIRVMDIRDITDILLYYIIYQYNILLARDRCARYNPNWKMKLPK